MKRFSIVCCFLMFSLLIISCGSKDKNADPMQLLSPEEILQAGVTQFNDGKYNDAILTYEKVLIYHPTSDRHIDAQLKIAECYGAMEKYESQMDALLRLLKENIIPERVPQIYTQIGKFYERAAAFNPGVSTTDTSDLNTAISYYQKAFNYKDSDDALAKAEAQYRRALVEAKINRIAQAIEHYSAISNQLSATPFDLLARVKLLDPQNTSELTMDETSLLSYRQLLGEAPAPEVSKEITVPEVQQQQPAPESTEQQKNQSENKSIEDAVFEQTSPDTTQTPEN